MAQPVRVIIVLPTDLTTFAVSGIHTFVEGFIKFAPDDFALAHVGVAGPGSPLRLRAWSPLEIWGRRVDVLPIMEVDDLARRGRIPRALRFTLALARHRRRLGGRAVLQFHRPATALPLLSSTRPRIQVLHLTSDQLLSAGSESRWRRLGSGLRRLEALTLPRLDGVVVVNEAAADAYRRRFPQIAERISFVPNWVDDTIFQPLGAAQRRQARSELRAEVGGGARDRYVLFVGRLEDQKDPLLALAAFAAVGRPGIRLLLLGEGSLRPALEQRIARLGLGDRVQLLPARSRQALARVLQASDVLLITSAHETGPTIAYEALACGLPVVAAAVGRVPALLADGAGVVAAERNATALATGLRQVLDAPRDAIRQRAAIAARPYHARTVLAPLYDLHRQLWQSPPSED